MQPQVKVNSKSLYDTDYQLWIDHTVAQLKSGNFSEVDVENLIEEVESLGRSDKRAILSYFIRLCEHFLKLQYWETERKNCFRGWKLEIITVYLSIKGYKKPPSFSRLRIIDSRQVWFNCIP